MWLICHIPYAVALSKQTDGALHITSHVNAQIQLLYICI